MGLASDYFEMLKNASGYETHCHNDYVNTLDKRYLKEWESARIIRSNIMDLCCKLFNVEPKDESWCKMKHISLVSVGCQENAVRLIEDGLFEEIKRLAEIERRCYIIFLELLEINEENAKIKSSA